MRHTRTSNPLNVLNDHTPTYSRYIITHLPNPGMSEPSPIACGLRNLIPEATQVLLLKEEIKSLCEYMNTQNAIRARQPYMLI